MRLFKRVSAVIAGSFSLLSAAIADETAFTNGTAIPDFGKIAMIEGATPIPQGASFKVRFDVTEKSQPEALNRTFNSAARFINMHYAAGVVLEDIDLAIVIHSNAVEDVTNEVRFGKTNEKQNANVALIAALQEKGVSFYVCGQSAAYYDVAKADLLPGVELSLSAMTAHALLDARGYTLNPF